MVRNEKHSHLHYCTPHCRSELVPLFVSRWRLRPHIVPDANVSSQHAPLRTHLDSLIRDYVGTNENRSKDNSNGGEPVDVAIVNLIDKKGKQGLLGDESIHSS